MRNTPAYMDQQPADGATDMPQGEPEMGQITLDKANADVAEAFAECKPGDMYKVVKDDENEVILEKVPAEDEMAGNEPAEEAGGQEAGAGMADENEDSGFKSDKPAIAILLAKKRKQ